MDIISEMINTVTLQLLSTNYSCMFNIDEITLNNIYQYLIDDCSFDEEELNECTFICNGIMDFDTLYTDSQVLVMTTNPHLKQKFMNCMISFDSDTESQSDNDTDSTFDMSDNDDIVFINEEETEEPNNVDMTSSESGTILELKLEEEKYNDKPVDYLTDPDFKKLINIITNKPSYLQLACMFIRQGDIVEDVNEYEWAGTFDELYNKLKDEFDNDNLKNIICHFKGNENLIRRYLFKY